MKIRVPFERRPSWRDRFLEIARQAEGGTHAPRVLAIAAGLRLRLRGSTFAVQRRARAA